VKAIERVMSYVLYFYMETSYSLLCNIHTYIGLHIYLLQVTTVNLVLGDVTYEDISF